FSGLHTKVAVYMLYRLWVQLFDMDERWGVLTIGTGLGNARFTNRRNGKESKKEKDEKKVKKSKNGKG
ncbi:MAG: hypothetical protein DI543_09015, partial [Bradyrhizobium icense]